MTVRCRCLGLCGQDVPIVAAEFCGSAGVAVCPSPPGLWGPVAGLMGRQHLLQRAGGAGPLQSLLPHDCGGMCLSQARSRGAACGWVEVWQQP